MALVPTAVKRRLLARALYGGGPGVHLFAFLVHPAVYLKRMSFRRGVMGSSTFWRIVSVFAYFPGAFRRFFGKHPKVISSETLRPPQYVSVLTAVPLSRKEQKRTGITRKVLERKALADVAAAKGVEPAS